MELIHTIQIKPRRYLSLGDRQRGGSSRRPFPVLTSRVLMDMVQGFYNLSAAGQSVARLSSGSMGMHGWGYGHGWSCTWQPCNSSLMQPPALEKSSENRLASRELRGSSGIREGEEDVCGKFRWSYGSAWTAREHSNFHFMEYYYVPWHILRSSHRDIFLGW